MLETERLLLRPWRVSEAAIQRELWAERDPRVPPHRRIDADGHPTIAEIEGWIRESRPTSIGLLAVERKAAGDVIGYCGLIEPPGSAGQGGGQGDVQGAGPGSEAAPELAYELLRRVWGHGYATEASWAVLDRARACGFDTVTATVWEWNTASRRVLAKLGFTESDHTEVDAVHGTNLFTTKRL